MKGFEPEYVKMFANALLFASTSESVYRNFSHFTLTPLPEHDGDDDVERGRLSLG